MAQFNPQELQVYFDTRNYAGAAEYLRKTKAKDYASQLALNSKIHDLEKIAAKQKSIYSNLDNDQQQAYDFMSAMLGEGSIPRNRTYIENGQERTQVNNYGTEYLNKINNLRSDNGNNIKRIAIDIENDDDLEALSKSLGYGNINDNTLGISVINLGKNKGNRLIIDSSNKNLYKVLSATNKLSDKSSLDIINNIGSEATKWGLGTGAIGATIGSVVPGVGTTTGGAIGGLGGMVVGIIKGGADEILNAVYRSNKYKIKGIDSKGKLYDDGDFNYDDLQDAIEIGDKANTIMEDVKATKTIQQNFVAESVVSNFLGAGHAEAYKLYKQHKIDLDTYNKIEANWKKTYDTLINQADFTQKEVYAWSADSGEGVNLKPVKNELIPDLKGEVMSAMHDNRVTYSLCVSDGELGTLITIAPKAQSGDDKTDWSKKKGEIQKQIWVKGLFEGTAEKAFESDTKTKAARDNADMKKFNYELPLVNGKTVGYKPGTGPYSKTTDKNGNTIYTSISEEEMIHNLNENNEIEEKALEALNLLNHDPNNYNTSNIMNKIRDSAISATKKLYPKGSVTDTEREYHANEIARNMTILVYRYYKLQNQK
jgi:hypothetical protein